MRVVRVAIVGDFDRLKHSHWATEAALFHAAARAGVTIAPRWIATPEVDASDPARLFAEYGGIWGAPGSPYQSMSGILKAIEHARTRDVPYLGTCAGFQYALIEFTRNVLGVADADSAENDPEGKNIVITPIDCPMPDQGAKLAGSRSLRPVPGSLLQRLCGAADLEGEYFCNFETNGAFIERWEAAGLTIAARGADGELRAFELPNNRFFIATLFRPQLSSSHDGPHALVEGFVRACAEAG